MTLQDSYLLQFLPARPVSLAHPPHLVPDGSSPAASLSNPRPHHCSAPRTPLRLPQRPLAPYSGTAVRWIRGDLVYVRGLWGQTQQEDQAAGQHGARVEAQGHHEQHKAAEVAVPDAVIDPLAVMVKILGERGEGPASRSRSLAQSPLTLNLKPSLPSPSHLPLAPRSAFSLLPSEPQSP